MWISKIQLLNFKSYRQAEFVFPEPRNGKNIILIGGMNGYGKTSILEAIYLCLYGKDAISHLGRAGLKAVDYSPFITKAFNGVARIAGTDRMSVRVIIHCDATKVINIYRTWYFKSNGQFQEEETTVIEDEQIPRKDGSNEFHLSEMLKRHFVPAHIAPFFFFDGEEVKQLADQSRIEQVKLGLEGLLGVVLLRGLVDRLEIFEGKYRALFNKVDEKLLAQKHEDLIILGSRRDSLQQEINEIVKVLRQLTDRRTELLNRISSAGGGGGDVAAVKDLIEQKAGLNQQKQEVQKGLEDILANQLPFYLISQQLLMGFKTQLQREIALAKWEDERQSLLPRRDKFRQEFFAQKSPDIAPPLTEGQVRAIKNRIEQAWESLFYPVPTDCAGAVVHDYIQNGLRKDVCGFFDSVIVGQQTVQELLTRQRHLDIDISALGVKINMIEGLDQDGTLNKLKVDLTEIIDKIESTEQRHREKDREVQAVTTEISNLKPDYEREKKRLDAASPARKLANQSGRVRDAIAEVVPALYALKVEALGQAMTEVYHQLAHKDQVARIKIDNDGTTHILDITGKEIDFDRSAGENQIFATAIIAGLAKVSGVKAPLIVDTPLGRLDSRHRENIFKFWTSDPQRQVILLSQDKEIDFGFYERIRDRVGAIFLLQHEKVTGAEGIGDTIVHAGQYFNSGAAS